MWPPLHCKEQPRRHLQQKMNSNTFFVCVCICNEIVRRTNVQQLTCNIDLSCSFYYIFFSFILLELKPFVLKGKVLGEKLWKSVKIVKKYENSETILPFSCCPLVFLWEMHNRINPQTKCIIELIHKYFFSVSNAIWTNSKTFGYYGL